LTDITHKNVYHILLFDTVTPANALRNRKPHGHALQAVGTCKTTHYTDKMVT